MSTERLSPSLSVYGHVSPLEIPKTMLVKDPDAPNGHIIINVADFDPATMTEFRPPAA